MPETGEIFRELLERKQSLLGDQKPWSIAELLLGDEGLDELRRWLSGSAESDLPKATRWSRVLDPGKEHADDVVCGLLLHALYCEEVRRRGSEGRYWAAVRQLPWPPGLREQWFFSSGQPSTRHRNVLETSAQVLRLRHRFGHTGIHEWFQTGFMQFGFTFNGLSQHLPDWLAHDGIAPAAISTLAADPTQQSNSFQELWRDLKAYRRGNLTAVQLKQRIADTAWILPEWHEVLLKQVKKHLHLGVSDTNDDTGNLPFRCVSAPKLQQRQDGTPFFVTELEELANLDLVAENYEIWVDSNRVGRLVRQPDGSYAPAGEAAFEIEWTVQTAAVQLLNPVDGGVVGTQILTLWQASEGIQVFNAEGDRFADPHAVRRSIKGSLRLLFPCSLELRDAAPTTDWHSADDCWRLISLPGDTAAKLFFGDEVFWSLKEAIQPPTSPPDLEQCVEAWAETNPNDGTTTWHVRASGDYQIRWARLDLEAMAHDSRTALLCKPNAPEQFEHGAIIHLGLRYKRRPIRHRIRVPYPFAGTLWTIAGQHREGAGGFMSARAVASSKLLFRAVRSDDHHQADPRTLMEGSRIVRRIPSKSFFPGPMRGLGEALTASEGPFNQANAGAMLATAITDGGIIQEVLDQPATLSIYPHEGSPPREDLQWFAWVAGHGHPPRMEPIPTVIREMGGKPLWVAPRPFHREGVHAVAAFLDGHLVGNWWDLEQWVQVLGAIRSAEDAADCATWLRVARCPLLYGPSVPGLARFMSRWKAPVLGALLGPDCVLQVDEEQLTSTEPSAAWLRGVGQICERSNATLDVADVDELIARLGYDEAFQSDSPPLEAVMDRLTAVSPILAADFAHTWLKHIAREALGADTANELLRSLVEALDVPETMLEDFSENITRLAPEFIRHEVNHFVTTWPDPTDLVRRNSELLFEHELIRRLATRVRLIHLTRPRHVPD